MYQSIKVDTSEYNKLNSDKFLLTVNFIETQENNFEQKTFWALSI